jgi:CDP-paratose 2-epimerase
MQALITGGAGFIGCNLAHRLLSLGHRVRVFDNLSRAGSERNLVWLRQLHGAQLDISIADVREPDSVRSALDGVDQVFHFAAQVAVTTSVEDPVTDFSVNALGTLNVLEGIRALDNRPGLILTSTNKVYGTLKDVRLARGATRYIPVDSRCRAGISEKRPLDFHSPYGCSKGTADQYVLDYSRIYGIPAAVFRMSCIYGPRQFGNEDQGWVAHFLIRALSRQPITIYGDGAQLRDILFIDDLLDAFILAQFRIRELSGNAFNIGGGYRNSVSLIELLRIARSLTGIEPELQYQDWRPGDQLYYVSDYTKFRNATHWEPAVSAQEGVRQLYDWLAQFRTVSATAAAMQETR